MGRTVAWALHSALSLLAVVLYVLFVVPRWWELTGDTSHALGNVLRIVTGALIGLGALPAVLTLLRTRSPELGTPHLALSLRKWSMVAHVLSGVLIIGTAISEFWLRLDAAGPYLFAIYGAAAAIGILGIAAFYLSFVAESPPPPPKPASFETEPVEAQKPRRRLLRRSKGAKGEGAAGDAEETPTETLTEAAPTETPTETPTEAAPTAEADEPADTQPDAEADEPPVEGLRNRRPTGKGSHRLRRQRTPSDPAPEQ